MKKPTIESAKKMAKDIGADGLIILAFDLKLETIAAASYGSDRKKCDVVGKWLDRIFARRAEWCFPGDDPPTP